MLSVPALRHGLVTTAVALVACTLVAAAAWGSWQAAQRQLAGLAARSTGEIVSVTTDVVRVRWQPPGSPVRTSEVELSRRPPSAGSRTQIAFDPADPSRLTLPGSTLIAAANRALADLACVGVVAAGLLVASAVRGVTAAGAVRGPPRAVQLRRVRVQSGLISRSWLELEDAPQRWIPVHFDPVLVTLPSPTEVLLHGGPRRDRRIAATIGGRRVYPSGTVRRVEPRGRRIDNPACPDADTARRAREATLARHLRVDLVLALPAPVVGLLWAFVSGGGAASWAGATLVTATVGVWTGAYRGSDPT
ncbi:MAG: hypothetical protein WKH47_07365 [Actinomycetes bacterium]